MKIGRSFPPTIDTGLTLRVGGVGRRPRTGPEITGLWGRIHVCNVRVQVNIARFACVLVT